MTEEQKQAASRRMKAMHAAKKAAKEVKETVFEEEMTIKPTLNPGINDEPKETISLEQYNDLLRMVQEMQKNNAVPPVYPTGPQATNRGLIGTFEKYLVDPKNYPNPCERLANEPKLQRFAFKDNYELTFKTEVTSYETKDGINTKEPRFTLELHRIVFDEDTGEQTNGRYVVCRGIFHEDPQAALVIAREQNIEVDESNEKGFLDEMRYLRMRDWLTEAFYQQNEVRKRRTARTLLWLEKLSSSLKLMTNSLKFYLLVN